MSTQANLFSTSEWWRTRCTAISKSTTSRQLELKSDMGWCHGQLNVDSRCEWCAEKAFDGCRYGWAETVAAATLASLRPLLWVEALPLQEGVCPADQPHISTGVFNCSSDSKSVRRLMKQRLITPFLRLKCGVWRIHKTTSDRLSKLISRFYPTAAVLTACQASFRINMFGILSNAHMCKSFHLYTICQCFV